MVAPAGNTVYGTGMSNMLYRLFPVDSIQFANMCKINIKKCIVLKYGTNVDI